MARKTGASAATAPAKGELEQMLRRLSPEIARLFKSHSATEDEARRLLGETLTGFSHKWGNILNRERWLLRSLEKALREARRRREETSRRAAE
jgi:hypothetical protein